MTEQELIQKIRHNIADIWGIPYDMLFSNGELSEEARKCLQVLLPELTYSPDIPDYKVKFDFGGNSMKPWEERFVNEYKELVDRRKKLGAMLEKWNLGQLDFTPKCPYDLLWKQYRIMGEYESVLLERAKIEGIEL